MMFRSLFVSAALAVGALSATLAYGAVSEDRSARTIWLEGHNKARAQFGSAPLSWNAQLERDARRWAQKLAKEQRMRHAPPELREGSGENVWMGTIDGFTPKDMIDDFVLERVDFVSGRFPNVSRTGVWRDVGHYTQMVWPQTREVGCALAQGEEFEVMVCRYWPAGNQMGEIISTDRRLLSS